jgi:hypothetical protein
LKTEKDNNFVDQIIPPYFSFLLDTMENQFLLLRINSQNGNSSSVSSGDSATYSLLDTNKRVLQFLNNLGQQELPRTVLTQYTTVEKNKTNYTSSQLGHGVHDNSMKEQNKLPENIPLENLLIDCGYTKYYQILIKNDIETIKNLSACDETILTDIGIPKVPARVMLSKALKACQTETHD